MILTWTIVLLVSSLHSKTKSTSRCCSLTFTYSTRSPDEKRFWAIENAWFILALWVKKSKSRCIFFYVYFSFRKERHFYWINSNPYALWLLPKGSAKDHYLKSSLYYHYFACISSLKRAWPFRWSLNEYTLCMFVFVINIGPVAL